MDKDASRSLLLVECPRDAFQGFARLIPVERKVAHLETLVRAGFRTIDFGSFVSPKAVPQMADTEAVWRELVRRGATSGPHGAVDWIGIVANERGLERLLALPGAAGTPGVTTAGFPFSCSNTFQERNTGASIAATWPRLDTLVHETSADGRRLDVYLSMAFGNPFGDPWSAAAVVAMARELADHGVTSLLLADTVGTAAPAVVESLFAAVRASAPALQLGVHLHARADDFIPKVDAALRAGCTRFDAALGGVGGCPFAGDDLVGNLPTEPLARHLEAGGHALGLDREGLAGASFSAAALQREFGGAEPGAAP